MASYYSLVPCCDPTAAPLNFRPGSVSFPVLPAVYLFEGLADFDLVRGLCYNVTELTGTTEFVLGLNAIPNGINFTYLSDGCEDAVCECPAPCFILYNCDGFIIKTDTDLIEYLNEFITLVEYPGECYFVTQGAVGECGIGTEKVTPNPDVPCECDCKCYTVTGAGLLVYYDCDFNETSLSIDRFAPAQICSVIYPIVQEPGQFIITAGDNCIDGLCAEQCFLLTNCQTAETISSNSPGLIFYFNNSSVITLVGHEGCWQISEDLVCECPIPVTIQGAYTTCEECIPDVAFRLTSCTNPNYVIYSTEDLLAYVGKVISTDCGCLTVEQIDYIPPSTQPVVVLDVFDTCAPCNADYYLLQDCTGIKSDIYTLTDLSTYVGEVVQLKYCPDTCWTVSNTRIAQDDGVVTVEQSFGSSCSDCLISLLEAQCVSFTNTSIELPIMVNAFGLDGKPLRLTIKPGDTVVKDCYLAWLVPVEITVTAYGLCVDGECPPVIYPKRSVRPGYNTPVCDQEKYEKITCKASEILYKEVMQKRYGISDCCPDENLRWLIKKELIDLDALVDPDYICSASVTCCDKNVGCGEYISMEITHPYCPPRRCLQYLITVQVNEDGLIHYRGCDGLDTTIPVYSAKTPLQITICGLEGQGPNQIYCDIPSLVFTIDQTDVICLT